MPKKYKLSELEAFLDDRQLIHRAARDNILRRARDAIVGVHVDVGHIPAASLPDIFNDPSGKLPSSFKEWCAARQAAS